MLPLIPEAIRNSAEFIEASQLATDATLNRREMETGWSRMFPTLMPQSVKLNDTPLYRWATVNGVPVLENFDEIGYVVPFLDALKQFLGIKVVDE